MTVYDFMNVVVYEGAPDDCFAWIIDKADALSDGRKLYRTWQSEGYTYYDVGAVYHVK